MEYKSKIYELYEKYNSLVFTTNPLAEQAGLNEINNYIKHIDLVNIIDIGVIQIVFKDNFNDVLFLFHNNPPIFIRHIFPILAHFEIDRLLNRNDKIAEILKQNMEYLDNDKTFSIQNYILKTEQHSLLKLNIDQISSLIIEHNFVLNVTCPDQIITIMRTAKEVYIGISLAEDNISNWAGGKHRFSKKDNFISRAEFKLLEAIDVFSLEIPQNGIALDLGAAPGGWTKVLRKYNMTVHSVDPSNLHVSLLMDEQIIHHKETAQIYLLDAPQFDVIVNDMKMDINESIQIMFIAVNHLKENGICVLTLKLPKKKWQSTVKKALNLLHKKYHVVGARQLFNNRSEITVILKKH